MHKKQVKRAFFSFFKTKHLDNQEKKRLLHEGNNNTKLIIMLSNFRGELT